ncbi:rhamnan synthesis F family protein [Methylobacterium ajmalii]|uniref:rhamnosyltransferase WsaF family glycosyltransferase n=1 Tax=Methylobacterium ajmalii TaxID=2738439 RepID=UPI002F35DB73
MTEGNDFTDHGSHEIDEYKIISSIFDAFWYINSYHDVAEQHIDPIAHYIQYGAREGKDPISVFDTDWYVQRYPDVADSRLNPLVHYLLEGGQRGYAPHPLFDPEWYASQGDVKNPVALLDYLQDMANWRRSTHPLFDGAWYLEHYQDVALHQLNPLCHFLQSGARELRDPSPLFVTRWYFERHPETLAHTKNPLVDYVDRTDFRGRDPNPFFFSEWYLLINGDVSASEVNPLVHYATAGWREGRNPTPYFDTAWYRARYPEVEQRKIDPLTHFLRMGGKEAGYITCPVDRHTHDCDALDIPYEIVRAPASLADRDVCLFVAYSAEGRIEDYVVSYMKALHREGLSMILVIVTEGMSEPIPATLDFIDGILIRTNHGWDFAAWATALAAFPDIWRARMAILANDSVYGPTDPAGLAAVLRFCRESDKDIVALTDSHQVRRHLMSYFTAVTQSGLKNQAIREFWNSVRSNRDKSTVIHEYEIRSIERWDGADVTWDVMYPTAVSDALPINPTLRGWRTLVESGFPFLKVQLLRDFASEMDAEDWASSFSGNPELVPLIASDLERRRHRFVPPFRPVPNPKQRYIQSDHLTTYYGATTSVRPSDETDLALEVPFRPVGDAPYALPERVAVIAHIFYPDLAPSLLDALRRIPVPADIYISTDSEAKQVAIHAAFEHYDNGRIDVRVFPNRGRDIAPMLIGFADVFKSYEIFLHIHSKKSPHDSAFADWREFLLDNLLGSPDVVRSILHVLHNHDVGAVFSQHFAPVRHLLNFGYNFSTMRDLLGRCSVTLTQDMVLEFPSSSFFWMRTAAIRSLLDLGLTWSDFPEEAGQVDGTLAHAIERSLLYLTESAGLRWAKVGRPWKVPFEMLVPVQGVGQVEDALARVHRPLLNNRVTPLKEATLISEVNNVFARRDPNPRPRLTVIVPTLQPIKTFGGLTTALRFFADLGKRMGDDVDLRIVSISERIDLVSMLAFPEYRLLPISAVSDDHPRVVVDASERQRGFLSVRRNEIFVATAWWTAAAAYALQEDQARLHGRKLPVVYLIQDHESYFYPWSSRFGIAESTYGRTQDTVAVLNAEEFANYFSERYGLSKAYVLPFALNPVIEAALTAQPRERIILVYGRPSVDRNCFPLICQALGLWQRADPITASRWRILSAGESFDPLTVSQVRNLEVRGKLSLAEYAELLSTASVGLSLMVSPHPSYPPLEMAFAGLHTITNAYANKDLSLRSKNIESVAHLDASVIADALGAAVAKAEAVIGTIVHPAPLDGIPCEVPTYDGDDLAGYLRSAMSAAV